MENLESQLAARMEQLQATVQSKTAVPTAQVYVRQQSYYYDINSYKYNRLNLKACVHVPLSSHSLCYYTLLAIMSLYHVSHYVMSAIMSLCHVSNHVIMSCQQSCHYVMSAIMSSFSSFILVFSSIVSIYSRSLSTCLRFGQGSRMRWCY